MLRKDSLRLFDVTIRHTLQSLDKPWSLKEKINILNNVIVERNPSSIEIGSVVSSNMLFQTYNSNNLFNSVIPKTTDIYMLIPNIKSLDIAFNNNIKNFSFITSVSNEFQKKILIKI